MEITSSFSLTVYKTKSPGTRSWTKTSCVLLLRLVSSQSVPRWWRGRGNIWMHDWRVTAQEKSCNGSVHPHPIPLPHKNPSTLFSQELLGLQLSKYATVVNSTSEVFAPVTGNSTCSKSEQEERKGEEKRAEERKGKRKNTTLLSILTRNWKLFSSC